MCLAFTDSLWHCLEGMAHMLQVVKVAEDALTTVGDSGVGQWQLNETASKNTLQLSEFEENQCITSLLKPMEKKMNFVVFWPF